ncbi:XrtA/PEP-CTERM system TPR-repeat protein PrsT [Massilia puerhi]|uniref:XrtA/PEP-CTERM system TPR-repeat protein PrsT n=1 Tax=Massilia puerhi TaxID=2681550 RepID=UPI00135770C3|nr:XrtA/PEP-CTERM system TPR-repeat protein PrsT [Massilia puerhi]
MPRHVSISPLALAVLSSVLLLSSGLAGCSSDQSTPALIAEAKEYQAKGDRKAALIQLKNAVAKSPEDASARLELGKLHLEMGDILSADKELRRAASLGISPDQVVQPLAQALQAQGKFKESLDELKPELAAKSAPLLALKGNALLAIQQADAAKQAFEQALTLQPFNGAAMIGLARHALVSGNREEAARLVGEAVEKDARNPDVWFFHAAMLRAAGKNDEALASYAKVAQLRPTEVNAHVEQAYLNINQGKYDQAKANIEAARKQSPGALQTVYAQALLEFSQGNHVAARESLLKILKAAPDHMPSILLAGAVELNLGSVQQAELYLRKYLQNDPNNLYASKLLVQTLLKSEQPGAAVDVLSPILAKHANDAQLLALTGQSHMQNRDFGKAAGYLEKAAKLAPEAAVVRTSLGMARLSQGQNENAIAELQRATELDPKSPGALVALAQAEAGLKSYDKALAALARLEKIQPDNPQTHHMKGAVLLAKGDQSAARAAWDKALALQPNYFPTVSALVRLDLAAKNIPAAKKRFETVLTQDPKNFAALGGLAELAILENKPEDATRFLEKAQSENPTAIVAVLKLGNLYLATKQADKALRLARNYNAQHPTNAELLDLLGQAQLASNDGNGAVDTYSKLTGMLPKSGFAQMRLAQAQMVLENESAAAEALRRGAALQPELLPVRTAQIELALRRGKHEEALAMARQVQKDLPASQAGLVLEGDVHLALKKPDAALAAYDKAFAMQPTSVILMRNAGILRSQGKNGEAQQRLTKWLKQNPTDNAALLYLAEMHLAANQDKEAIPLLQNIIKRVPNHVVALNNLAYAFQQEKDPRALPTAEQAYKLADNNPAVIDTYGWLLVEQGDVARGVPLLQKAAGLAPNAPEIRYHYAVGLSKQGNKAAARKELETLLAENKSFTHADAARSLLKTL